MICLKVIYWVMYFVLHRCNDTVSVEEDICLKKNFGDEYFNIVIPKEISKDGVNPVEFH